MKQKKPRKKTIGNKSRKVKGGTTVIFENNTWSAVKAGQKKKGQ